LTFHFFNVYFVQKPYTEDVMAAGIGTPPHACPICGSTDQSHEARDHLFRICSSDGDPVALVANFQGNYNSPDVIARRMALIWADIKRCFPGKEFAIQPARLMLTKEGENGFLLGEAFVAEYIIYEV
jgi:hypothetical protein